MTPRTLMSNPLLLKELAAQVRRPGRAGWSYPGPVWFLVVTVVPSIVFLRQGDPHDARPYFLVAALLQTWLLAFRSSLYTATSMATDVRQGTIPVLLSSPLALAGALRAKLVASLLPLWLELLLALPTALMVYSWQGDVATSVILTVTAFQLAASVLFSGLGMWLGALLGDPERAARTSRLVVGLAILGTSLTPTQLPGPIVLVGILLWICLVWLPQVRPSQAVQGSVAALVILLILPVLYSLGRDAMAGLDLTAANPLRAIHELMPANPMEASHQALLAGDARFEALRQEAEGSRAPEQALGYALRSDAALLARLDAVHQFQGLRTLLPLGLIYVLGGLGLLRMARGRAASCT